MTFDALYGYKSIARDGSAELVTRGELKGQINDVFGEGIAATWFLDIVLTLGYVPMRFARGNGAYR